MKITECMQTTVYTCRPEDSLEEAAATMLKEDVGALPVIDSEDKLVGMITDRDICMSGLIEGRTLKELPVSLAASAPAWSCDAAAPVEEAWTSMQTHKIHRVPVVDADGKLVGILGTGDLVRATADKKSGVTPNVLTQTLTAVWEPRARTTPMTAV